MKNVVLIGDSIRIGYQPFVLQELDGKASVWGPEENGGNSGNVLTHLDEWVIARQPDVLHINAGLHDIRRSLVDESFAVAVAAYKENLRTIFSTIRDKTDTKIIWVSTTPIIEERHNPIHDEIGDFHRYIADVLAYNKAALSVVNEFAIPVNNLFRFVMDNDHESMLIHDGCHFTPEAYAKLGKVVADAVMNAK